MSNKTDELFGDEKPAVPDSVRAYDEASQRVYWMLLKLARIYWQMIRQTHETDNVSDS